MESNLFISMRNHALIKVLQIKTEIKPIESDTKLLGIFSPTRIGSMNEEKKIWRKSSFHSHNGNCVLPFTFSVAFLPQQIIHTPPLLINFDDLWTNNFFGVFFPSHSLSCWAPFTVEGEKSSLSSFENRTWTWGGKKPNSLN